MKKRLLDILIPAIAAAVSVIIALSLYFGAPTLNEPSTVALADSSGQEIRGVCISDLAETNYMRYAYYTPDEFTMPALNGFENAEFVDVTNHENRAARGTYRFIVFNIDPMAEDFSEQKEKLDPYLGGDSSWHFSAYLPPCYSACVVYVQYNLAAEAGSIADYDYIRYSEKPGYSEVHSDGSEPVTVDLSFYSSRNGIGTTPERRAKIITVHYESAGVKSGFDCIPIIGVPGKVERIVSDDGVFQTVIALAAAFVFAVLAFACVLKKSPFAAPQAVMALGIAGFAFFASVMYAPTGAPLFSFVGLRVCVGVIAVAAALSVVYAVKSQKREFLVLPPVAAVFCITFLCIPFRVPILLNPVMWLAVIMLCVTTFSAFKFFADVERRNEYLTYNLKTEVARQTEDLKTIVEERDKLLRYLSHDMKKPVKSIKSFVAEILKSETDPENIKALNIINDKLDGMQTDFAELQKFAKLNFAAEESVTVYVNEIIDDVYKRLSPDCDANGITLKCVSLRYAVFAKRSILASVIDNLVFNAIEHAHCQNILISTVKNSRACHILVADDGTGIENERDVFLPYYSDNADGDNLGLGLYICRQHLLSMGGDLQYSRENNKTVFRIILPLA